MSDNDSPEIKMTNFEDGNMPIMSLAEQARNHGAITYRHLANSERLSSPFVESDNPDLNLRPNRDGPISFVFGTRDGRQLLKLAISDGMMTAHYEPADLDEAARVFIERVNEMLGR